MKNEQIIINGIYSYTNKHNYTTTIKVSRFNDKSIFVYALLDDGNFSDTESRMSLIHFASYSIQSK